MNKLDSILGSRYSSNSHGFTLIEILIAVTLLAFVSIGVISITDNALLTKERTTLINKNNLEIETAMNRFEWDFSQIYSPLFFSEIMNLNNNPNNENSSGQFPTGVQENPFLQEYFEQLVRRFERNEHFMGVSQEGLPVPRFFSPDKSTLEFFTTSNRRKRQNQKQSYFAWVRYALETPDLSDSEESNSQLDIPSGLKNIVRYFNPFNPYSDEKIDVDGTNATKGSVLLTRVESLEFQFWDYEKRKWQTSLRSIRQGESIIKGIKVIITWYDAFGVKKVVTRFFRPLWPLEKFKNRDNNTPINLISN